MSTHHKMMILPQFWYPPFWQETTFWYPTKSRSGHKILGINKIRSQIKPRNPTVVNAARSKAKNMTWLFYPFRYRPFFITHPSCAKSKNQTCPNDSSCWYPMMITNLNLKNIIHVSFIASSTELLKSQDDLHGTSVWISSNLSMTHSWKKMVRRSR